MTKIILYPNFAGVDIKQEDDLDEIVKNISLLDILPNEKHKDDDYFSSVEMKQYLDKMTKDIDNLDPIILIKNPLEPGKYNVLDGHHRFQLFKKLNKKTIPAMVVDEKIVFLAKDEYGTKNNKAVRMDKADLKQIDLKNYFNTSEPQSSSLDEKWTEKYKKSIDCNNPKGFSQKAHCQGRKKKMNETEELEGGLADNKTLIQIAKKHDAKNYYHIDDMVKSLKKQLEMGMKVEMEHTNSKDKAKEIAMDHLWEDPSYYTKLKKIEAKEMTGADSAGAFSPAFGTVIKKKNITKIHNMTESEQEIDEVIDASSAGSYDVPFGGGRKGRKNPLKIDGPDSIYKGRAVKDKNFPKWGGPGGKFVKIKDKCKKFPYCNQGDINALELIESKEMYTAIQNAAIKTGLNPIMVKNMVLKEIKDIFI
jgi:hypothetical protein